MLILKFLFYILGIFLWFPAFSVFTVGDQTGVQVALLIILLIFIVQSFITRFRYRFDSSLLLVYCLWVLAITLSTFASNDQAASARGIIIYSSTLFVFFTVASSSLPKEFLIDNVIKGYIVGGVISSIYGIYQYIGFKINLPWTTLFNNNPAFPSYASYVNNPFAHVSRAFAFTPEPSQFSSLLIPAIVIVGYKALSNSETYRKEKYKNVLILIILLSGLLVSFSLSMIVTLPLALIIAAIFNLNRATLLIKRIGVIVPIIVLIVLFLFKSNLSFHEFLVVWKRVSDFSQDQSLIVRFGAMVAALKIFFHYPLTGYGLNAVTEAFIQYMPSYVMQYEYKKGVDSLPLAILAEQGIFGFFALIFMFITSLIRVKNLPYLFTATLAIILIFSLQTSYIYLYHLWVFMGLCFLSNRKSVV